jgi:hypothetical protein
MVDPIPERFTTLPKAVERLAAGIADRDIRLAENLERLDRIFGGLPLFKNDIASLAWAKRQLAVWKLYDAMRDDALKAFVRDPASGTMFRLEPGDWRGAAFWEDIIGGGVIRSSACESIERHQGRRVLIEEGALDRWLAAEKQRQPAAAVNDCLSWLEREMRASPSRSLKPKSDWFRQAKEKFSVSGRAFDRAWASSILSTGSQWGSRGRKSAR